MLEYGYVLKVMEKRGFVLNAYIMGHQLNFKNSLSIYCDVILKSESFQFIYVTDKEHKLTSLSINFLIDAEYFLKLYQNFRRDVLLLCKKVSL
jgi:hypothetical protein